MSTNKSITVGQKFGKLTILHDLGIGTHKSQKTRLVTVKCLCGTIKTLPYNQLRYSRTKSCGCRIIDINQYLNTKFGKLTIMGQASRAKGSRMVSVICECGNKKVVKFHALLSGNTKSCGACPKEKLSYKERAIFEAYIKNANQRGFVFELTEAEFFDLISRKCSYCGNSPMSRYTKNGPLQNGIDRYDNTIGYTKENCLTCCKICNRIKHTHSAEFLFNHIRKMNNPRATNKWWHHMIKAVSYKTNE
jgi:hypothetical protein